MGSNLITESNGVLLLPPTITLGGSNSVTLKSSANGLQVEKITLGSDAQISAGNGVTLINNGGRLDLPADSITISELAVGTGTSSISFSDTTLSNESYRKPAIAGYPKRSATGELSFAFVIDDTDANTASYTNIALFVLCLVSSHFCTEIHTILKWIWDKHHLRYISEKKKKKHVPVHI